MMASHNSRRHGPMKIRLTGKHESYKLFKLDMSPYSSAQRQLLKWAEKMGHDPKYQSKWLPFLIQIGAGIWNFSLYITCLTPVTFVIDLISISVM